MALQNSDLLAVYRTTTKTNHKITVGEVVALAPEPPAPSLNGVLQSGNISLGNDIIVEDSDGLIEQIKLDASLGAITATGFLTVNEYVLVSSNDPLIQLTEADTSVSGRITVEDSVFAFNNQEGPKISFQFASTEVASIDSNGNLEATSIDGGVYAE